MLRAVRGLVLVADHCPAGSGPGLELALTIAGIDHVVPILAGHLDAQRLAGHLDLVNVRAVLGRDAAIVGQAKTGVNDEGRVVCAVEEDHGKSMHHIGRIVNEKVNRRQRFFEPRGEAICERRCMVIVLRLDSPLAGR